VCVCARARAHRRRARGRCAISRITSKCVGTTASRSLSLLFFSPRPPLLSLPPCLSFVVLGAVARKRERAGGGSGGGGGREREKERGRKRNRERETRLSNHLSQTKETTCVLFPSFSDSLFVTRDMLSLNPKPFTRRHSPRRGTRQSRTSSRPRRSRSRWRISRPSC
jgi:hypothetical protein